MKGLPIQGAGLVSTMWGAAGEPTVPAKGEPRSRALCRQQVAYTSGIFGPIPANSTASRMDLPCIMIGDIQWQVQNKADSLRPFGIFNSNLLDYVVPGAAMLFESNQPTLYQMYSDPGGGFLVFPKPEIFTRSKLSLLVLLERGFSSCNVKGLENTTIFGSIATISTQEWIWKTESGFCYAYAATAGVVQFEEPEFISSYTLQGSDSGSRNLSQDFREDTWVRPAMMLLPDVMPLVSIANTSKIPTWNNLPGYVETLIQQSYIASWGLMRSFEDSHSNVSVSKAEPRLIASVNKARLWGWFIINMFVPLSGLIWYFGAQWGTGRELILDGPLTALLTRVQAVRGGGDLEGVGRENETLLVQQVSTMITDNEAGRIYLRPDASNGAGDGYGRGLLDTSAKETGAMTG